MTPALFIAGAGTEIGKTYTTAALTRHLRAAGRPVLALKPLASGVPPLDDPAFAQSDTARLLAAQGLPVTAETVAACSPWRFAAPLAPDQAAAREGRRLSLDALVAWCAQRLVDPPPPRPEGTGPRSREASLDASLGLAPRDVGGDGRGTTVLIEGVGGLMSPVTEDATGLDWLRALQLPTLLVSGSYLGAISHALTAIETLRAHGVPIVGIAVSESEGAPTPPETVAAAIGRHGRVTTGVLRRNGPFPEALADLV